MKPNWIGNGVRKGVKIESNEGQTITYIGDNHPWFIKWLEDNRLTLEQWLANNPEPVINKTVEEQRKEAYNKAWSVEEFQEAVFEHFNGKSDKLNLLNAKRNSIRDEIKKQKLEK